MNWAAFEDQTEIVEYLITKKGIMPDREGYNFKQAIGNGNLDMVKVMVEKGECIPNKGHLTQAKEYTKKYKKTVKGQKYQDIYAYLKEWFSSREILMEN